MYLGIISIYWKLALAYRAEFMMSVILVPLRFIVFLFIWTSLYHNTTTIQGYTLSNLITYFIISTITFIITYDTIANDLPFFIKTGNFTTYLIKPFAYPLLGFIAKIANRLFALLVEVIPTTIIFAIFFTKYFTLGNIPLYIIALIPAFIISYLISFIVATLAFWFIDIRSFSWLANTIIGITSGFWLPLELFPQTIQNIINYLPFKYLVYVPTQIYLGNYPTTLTNGFFNSIYGALSIQLFWTITLFIIAYIIWKRAINKFTGAGT